MAFTALGSTVLGDVSDTLEVDSLADKPYLHLESIVRGADTRVLMTFNADTDAHYSYRFEGNMGTDSNNVNKNNINPTYDTAPTVKFLVMDILNLVDQEKIGIGKYVDIGSAGVSNAPNTMLYVFKWIENDVIDKITFTNNDSGDYSANSSLNIFGSS
tara:strand:+ start:1590 stop:2063 length:474 start_codon:yes stop_codon:yes gene_type:complete